MPELLALLGLVAIALIFGVRVALGCVGVVVLVCMVLAALRFALMLAFIYFTVLFLKPLIKKRR